MISPIKTAATRIKSLTQAAKKAQKNAYAPYSGHPVGAAIITPKGKIYAGSNCENASWRSVCAEQAAISAMVSDGGRKIAAVVVISPGAHICTPCGTCRQALREFAAQDTEIICLDHKGKTLGTFTLSELLPHSFGPEMLARNKTGNKKRK